MKSFWKCITIGQFSVFLGLAKLALLIGRLDWHSVKAD
jgi:hypothetical protein